MQIYETIARRCGKRMLSYEFKFSISIKRKKNNDIKKSYTKKRLNELSIIKVL